MTKSAAEVMHDVILSAVIDGLGALRTASKGVPNAMLRDIGAIHLNTTFQDLPADLQASIQSSVRAAFTRLQSEGYTVLNPKVAGTNRPPCEASFSCGGRHRLSDTPAGRSTRGLTHRQRCPTPPAA